MSTPDQVLAKHPFFDGLDPHFLEIISKTAMTAEYGEGQLIFREGDPANRLFLIRQGKVSVEVPTPNRGSVVIETLGENDILGWSWIVPPYRKRFDARALEPTRAVVVDAKLLRSQCEEDPVFGYAVMKRVLDMVAQRLQATRLQLIDVYSVNP